MKKGSVLILGARSDVGLAVAHRFAEAGHSIQLAARNAATLENDRADLAIRHDIDVTIHEFDALATETHSAFVDGLPELPDIAVCAVGLLGNQDESKKDMAAAVLVIRTNYEGPASIIGEIANRFEARGFGVLVGISSVAGERGRASNYVYGSAKAGFTAYLSGLRNRLARKGVHVVTVLPGFIATRMTAGMNLPSSLTAQPKEVADRIFWAATKLRNVSYIKPIWALVMFIVRVIPERIFKETSI
jgi:decaprenylphospho-beta-D-erythro-pentofuranosid-2-ulose 2-reductase